MAEIVLKLSAAQNQKLPMASHIQGRDLSLEPYVEKYRKGFATKTNVPAQIIICSSQPQKDNTGFGIIKAFHAAYV